MNLFKNIKVFASFGNTIKALNIIINVIRGLALVFLIGQVIVLLKDAKLGQINDTILDLEG